MTKFNFSTSNKSQRMAANKLPPLPARMPERLVGVGFRCWFAGFESGDIASWEEAWNTYSGTLGRDPAKALLLDLSQFVRAVKTTAEREIQVYPTGCLGFCRDECLAISMIAACQHDAKPALHAAACALIGSPDIGDALTCAQTFAAGLKNANQVLDAASICPATCAFRADRRRLM